MTAWVVYTRPGCTLCDEFLEEFAHLLGPAEASRVALVDVDSDADLQRKYGTRIPVLTADGEFVCNYRLDPERLSAYLQDSP
jgi:hypothetical protein